MVFELAGNARRKTPRSQTEQNEALSTFSEMLLCRVESNVHRLPSQRMSDGSLDREGLYMATGLRTLAGREQNIFEIIIPRGSPLSGSFASYQNNKHRHVSLR